MRSSELALSASIELNVPSDDAFAFFAELDNLRHWALGCWDGTIADGVYGGRSLFDDAPFFARLEPHRDLLLVDIDVGTTPDRLVRLGQARVVPGERVALGGARCIATVTLWRGAGISDELWTRMYHATETEMHLIKGYLERPA